MPAHPCPCHWVQVDSNVKITHRLISSKSQTGREARLFHGKKMSGMVYEYATQVCLQPDTACVPHTAHGLEDEVSVCSLRPSFFTTRCCASGSCFCTIPDLLTPFCANNALSRQLLGVVCTYFGKWVCSVSIATRSASSVGHVCP